MLSMSPNVAIVYSSADLREVAEAFGEAAEDPRRRSSLAGADRFHRANGAAVAQRQAV
jgi:hypothetical protein